ncbi:hypothetical protein LCGC14_2352390 [marine sediment metagenome]|uniref:Amidase domain-containing protein n=1 Tax=marine sediment metagenome TaxID=412755 RepID=A0A0F9CWH5_9ZZZZ
MSNLNSLTIADARDGLRAKDFTSAELTEACLGAVEGASALNAFVHNTPQIARDQAAAADAWIAKGDAPAMCGIPLGIKDLFCTKGVPSQAASRILEGFRPEYESTVGQQLWASGAVMLGKLNMDEFAMGSSNETSVYGNAINPWRREGDDARLTPGGSSGGSAAAVAADLCLAATGTDTGGSIRQPAAFTGITGLKPTYGRVSRWGIIAFASSLDQAGPMTKTVRDAAIMLQAMAGHDPLDSTSADLPVPDFEAALTGDIKGKKIGIPNEYRIEGMPAEIAKLWEDGTAMLRDAACNCCAASRAVRPGSACAISGAAGPPARASARQAMRARCRISAAGSCPSSLRVAAGPSIPAMSARDRPAARRADQRLSDRPPAPRAQGWWYAPYAARRFRDRP